MLRAWTQAAQALDEPVAPAAASGGLRYRSVWISDLHLGTPVAAYPVPGPLDVVGTSAGGVLHEDLRQAALAALSLPREQARARALQFDWAPVCDQFVGFLVAARRGSVIAVTKPTQKLHKLLS